MKNVLKTIPVVFEKVDQVDTRFQKVKIWLMHLGQNYNNSIFTKEAVEDAMESLKNTPILGYVEESMLGDKDFRGHEVELVIEDGEFKTKYVGTAYGVIPENCNPRFETKKGDFDNELEYLVVDGLMWTKFEDGVNILNNFGEVAQSMELHDDYDAYFNEDGVLVFTRFSFYGACLLGQDVLPAMQKASVEVNFSSHVQVYQEEISRKLEEFQLIFERNQEEEVEKNMTLTDVITMKYSVTVEQLAEKGIVIDDYTLDNVAELERKIEEAFELKTPDDPAGQLEGEEPEGEGNGEGEFSQEGSPEPEATDPEKFSLRFELSHDDIRTKLYSGLDQHIALATGQGEDWGWNYIVSVYETHMIVEDDYGQKFHKVEYTKDGDNITLGSVNEVFASFLTNDEKNALELMRSSFEQYEKENTELKEFQSNVLKGQHEALAEEVISQFDKLSEDDVAEIRENIHNFTLEQIESKCFEMVGRKTTKFSAPKGSTSYSMKIGVIPEKETPAPSSFAELFKKHGMSVN